MFKWIYSLGVQHENLRIRKLLAEFSAHAREHNELFFELAEKQKPRQKALDEVNVRNEALRLIDELIITKEIIQHGSAPIDVEKSDRTPR